ncbi:TetR/AcrR family transcriptional regulator C-terminal domain-containing protein [Saccharopolyspora indica]|uniref:TetR/AcrR family transcriptional regulator C-terminal domain-containing protein n=1 Tax=Saccharopolyspora indica TaxID=1229659 RepID=UPI0022EB5B14|nr:TetR/AcrR family transcriptional regulator C-terminal domain-containing protein [Saccharopolyspora indica]MDA3643126.1 TetR/AcrR family transcriptional regulator C-terminal domain-containing protein [Saccharopolyspora indica]
MPAGPPPPYLRIVADIRARIDSGQLRPGDRVPSTRQITDEWGVAMATATKALATLRREGLVHPVTGTGTVVAEPTRRRAPRTRTTDTHIDQQRIVHAAITIADAEGRTAVSMRRVAAELGAGTMSLYRHVPDKDELLRLMADAALAETPLPEPSRRSWRRSLEKLARQHWATYRRHPWLAPIALTSLAQPPLLPTGVEHLEWQLTVLSGLGLPRSTALHVAVSVNGFVGGLAMSHAMEREYTQETGLTVRQRHNTDRPELHSLLGSGRYPELAATAASGISLDLDQLFEFGLQRHLDGIAAHLTTRNHR